jgi:signal transduction histidine kinase
MKFSFRLKIFLSIVLPSILLFSFITFNIHNFISKKIKSEYIERYESVTSIISDTLQQLESSAEVLSRAGAKYLYLYYKVNGLPSEKKLQEIKKNIGVSQMCITNREGFAIRDTETPEGKERNFSLYQLCDEYKNLVYGDETEIVTPIIPSYPIKKAYKLLMLPSPKKDGIVEAGVQLNSIGSILKKSIKSDKNLISFGLFTPNGKNLGYFEGKSLQPIFSSLQLTEKTEFFIDDYLIIAKKVTTNQSFCCECVYKNLTNSDNQYYYWLLTKISLLPLKNNLYTLNNLLLLIFFTSLIFTFFIAHFLSKYLVKRINEMRKTIQKIMTTRDLTTNIDIDSYNKDEIYELAKHFNEMISDLSKFHINSLEVEKSKLIQKITKQVAHDLGSPVMTLNMLLNKMNNETEEVRLSAREAIIRIRDISMSIFERYSVTGESNIKKKFATEQLAPIIDSIVSEKKIEYQFQKNVHINFNMKKDFYCLFVSVEAIEFKRILSNLINNSVESFEGNTGFINVSLESCEKFTCIKIEDNGKGMPEEIIEKIQVESISYSKNNGHGLGVQHAINSLSWWGGSLKIESSEGFGSVFSIILPSVNPPSWFIQKLVIDCETIVIVLDDDHSVHNIWKRRLNGVDNIKHCYNVEEFEKIITALREKNILRHVLFLCDYDLRNKEKTGIDLITFYNLNKQSILVTSQHDEISLRERCEVMDIKFLPKSSVPFVPIEILK